MAVTAGLSGFKEGTTTVRVLAFDTESTDLKAMMGRILCASFAWIDVDGETGNMHVGPSFTFRADHRPWKGRSRTDDSTLCVAIRDQLERAHAILGWNSKLHDVPLLNARLAKAGHRQFNPHLHIDLMWYAGGSSMKIGSRKLDNVAKFFDLPSQKTPISWDAWMDAALLLPDAMNTVVEHCEADVQVLGEAYERLLPYVKNVHR